MLKHIDSEETIAFPKQYLREVVNEIKSYGMKRKPHRYFKLYEDGFNDALEQMALILNMKKTEEGKYDYDETLEEPVR